MSKSSAGAKKIGEVRGKTDTEVKIEHNGGILNVLAVIDD